MLDSQEYWNERRGTEYSDLYVAALRYTGGRSFSMSAEYRHEDVEVDADTADLSDGDTTYSYGYYGSGLQDRKVDSGSLSFQLQPLESLRLQPTYDVSRELELQSGSDAEGEVSVGGFAISERSHRMSLRPTINRSFFGMRPNAGAQVNARENWFQEQKDISMNFNVRAGASFRFSDIYRFGPEAQDGSEEAPPPEGGASASAEDGSGGSEGSDAQEVPAPSVEEASEEAVSDGSGDSDAPDVPAPSVEETSEEAVSDGSGDSDAPVVPAPSVEEASEEAVSDGSGDSEGSDAPDVPAPSAETEDASEEAVSDGSGDSEGSDAPDVPAPSAETEDASEEAVSDGSGDSGGSGAPDVPAPSTETEDASGEAASDGSDAPLAEAGGSGSELPELEDDFFREQENLDRMNQYGGFDSAAYEEAQLNRADWLGAGNMQLDRSLAGGRDRFRDDGLNPFQRSMNSLSLSGDFSVDVRDYLRRLDSDTTLAEAYLLPEDASERSSSTRSTRVSFRSSFDPLPWLGLSGDLSFRDSFTKNVGAGSQDESFLAGADAQFFMGGGRSTMQLSYNYNVTERSNSSSVFGDSRSQEGGLTWRRAFGETRVSVGSRANFRQQERSGVQSDGVIVTPSLSVDYTLKTAAGWRIPLLRKELKLEQDLSVTNYLTTVIRRESLGEQLDARSERYQTALQLGYRLSRHVRASLNLSLSYFKDRVEAGRNYFAVSSRADGARRAAVRRAAQAAFFSNRVFGCSARTIGLAM